MNRTIVLWLASAFTAWGQVLYCDNFEQFTNGTTLPDEYTYSPACGPAGTSARINRLATTSVTMTNLAGSMRVLFNCPASSVSDHWNEYHAYFAPQSNQVLALTWQLRIDAVKPGTLGIATVHLPIVGDDESTAIAFNDGGQIFAVTNVLTSVSDLVTIGSWSNLVGTVMTNQLVLNYPARTMALSVNGSLIATLPMRPDLTNYVDHINFEFDEITAYGSTGNDFALDEIQVGLASLQPALGLSMSGGLPSLSLSGLMGSRYTLEYVPELGVSNNWQNVLNYTNMLLTNSPQFFLDTSSPGAVRRFYRARLQ